MCHQLVHRKHNEVNASRAPHCDGGVVHMPLKQLTTPSGFPREVNERIKEVMIEDELFGRDLYPTRQTNIGLSAEYCVHQRNRILTISHYCECPMWHVMTKVCFGILDLCGDHGCAGKVFRRAVITACS